MYVNTSSYGGHFYAYTVVISEPKWAFKEGAYLGTDAIHSVCVCVHVRACVRARVCVCVCVKAHTPLLDRATTSAKLQKQATKKPQTPPINDSTHTVQDSPL